jgi:hypothetical protein
MCRALEASLGCSGRRLRDLGRGTVQEDLELVVPSGDPMSIVSRAEHIGGPEELTSFRTIQGH